MEIRNRSSKTVARRHDLNYFKNGSPINRWQWRFAAAAIAVSAIYLALASLLHGRELLSKGPVSAPHAVFGARCESCHVPMPSGMMRAAGFRQHVTDAACQSCHGVPAHQASAMPASLTTPECGSCHVEHVGSMMLANTADQHCTQCHANLRSSHYASGIHSFVDGHPEFASLRGGYDDDQKIKFNHQAHLQSGLHGPLGPVNMSCADCHRTPAVVRQSPWRFGEPAHLQPASLEGTADPLHPTDSRAYLAPVSYAANCRSCHTLKFDQHISNEAPHGSPADVRAFIRAGLSAFAEHNPGIVAAEIRNWISDPAAMVPAHSPEAPPRDAAQWIAVRSRQAERRLWYQSCNLCHRMKIPDDSSSAALTATSLPANTAPINIISTLPEVAPTRQRSRQLTNAIFSHQAHLAMSCESCHTRTRNSNQGTDILLPGIASCQKCHDGKSSPQGPALSSGHAESGCFLCHQYHDWNHAGTPSTVPHDLEFKSISELQPPR